MSDSPDVQPSSPTTRERLGDMTIDDGEEEEAEDLYARDPLPPPRKPAPKTAPIFANLNRRRHSPPPPSSSAVGLSSDPFMPLNSSQFPAPRTREAPPKGQASRPTAPPRVLAVDIPPSSLRPLAFRIFTKKHNLTLKSEALSLLCSFIGRKCGADWKTSGSAERLLEEVARTWKRNEGAAAILVDGNEALRTVIKDLEVEGPGANKPSLLTRGDSFDFARAETHPASLSRENTELSSLSGSQATLVSKSGPDLEDINPRDYLHVVDAFTQPKYKYNHTRKQFERASKPSLLPDATAKAQVFLTRYYLIHHRLLRNPSFQPPTFAPSNSMTSRGTKTYFKITPIAHLLGRSGKPFFIFGLLSTSPDTGQLTLEDPTGTIQLDITHAKPIPEDGVWFSPGSFVVVDGTFESDGRFTAYTIGQPPSERRETSAEVFGHMDFLGISMPLEFSAGGGGGRGLRLAEKRLAAEGKGRVVVLSEIHLDLPRTHEALSKLFEKWEAESVRSEDPVELPMTVILCGKFVSDGFSWGNGSLGFKEALDQLAATLGAFDSLLTRTTFVIVPSDSDPWTAAFTGGASGILPRKGLPDIFTNKLKRAFTVANRDSGGAGGGKIVFASNPCRVGYFTREIVVFRDDMGSRFTRNNVRFKQAAGDSDADNTRRRRGKGNTDENHEMDVDQIEGATDLPSTQEEEGAAVSNGVSDDVKMARKLVKTILDQSYLSPYPVNIRPVLWDYTHALTLFPLPNYLILADPSTPPFTVTYEGCHVLNPARFLVADERRKARYVEFMIGTQTGAVQIVVVATLVSLPVASALNWDDFTNNFATDLAPLITLFGEQITKQFLSESLSVWDNVIFAMAPLGLLTAVVSAIRVCGTPSMRAFIGRAQESPGTAEVELLSCTSETTAELFNEGGIARVFGEPRILEIMAAPAIDRGRFIVGLFSDVHRACHWVDKMEFKPRSKWSPWGYNLEEPISQYHRPNLSLNVGITKLPKAFAYAAAAAGMFLQAGTLVFAALTIYTFPDHFPTATGPAEAYAFPMTFAGTVLVCFGMFLCAFIIERSTNEVHYKRYVDRRQESDPCKIYWIQPGGQSIGDQVFGSFIGYSADRYYIRSIRASHGAKDVAVLWIAVVASVLGFVVQFVGLRAMHATVILVQIGATLLMSIIRAMLRTQRMNGVMNILSSPNKGGRVSRKNPFLKRPKLLHGHELDLFSLHLYKIDSIAVEADLDQKIEMYPEPEKAVRDLEDENPGESDVPTVGGPLETRQHLADITSSVNGPSWDDLEVRTMARQLSAAIEGLVEVLSSIPSSNLTAFPGDVLKWPIKTKYDPISALPHATILFLDETTTGQLARQSSDSLSESKPEVFELSVLKGEGVSWRVEPSQLEALIGLWSFSLTIRDIGDGIEEKRISNHRIFLGHGDLENTAMWYQTWIQRKYTPVRGQAPTELLSSRGIHHLVDQHLFGNLTPVNKDDAARALFVKTPNTAAQMCAQDIFMFFLSAAIKEVPDIAGKTETRESRALKAQGGGILLQNTVVEEIAARFETSGLGSQEDAYMCIYPVLQQLGKMPSVKDIADAAINQAGLFKTQGKWKEAESLLQWLCNNPGMVEDDSSSEVQAFSKALIELYHSSLWDLDEFDLGFDGICKMLMNKKMNLKLSQMVQEYAWIALRIADDKCLDEQKSKLLSSGAKEDLVPNYNRDFKLVDWAKENCTVAIKYLLQKQKPESNQESDPDLNSQDFAGLTPLHWAIKHKNIEVANIFLEKNVDTNIFDNDLRGPISYAAEIGNPGLLEALLKRNEIQINLQAEQSGKTALILAAENGHIDCVRLLLAEQYLAVDEQDKTGATALYEAASKGHVEILELLLIKGANAAAETKSKRTALHAAAERGYTETVQVLLPQRINLDHEDEVFMTALDLASLNGFISTARLLLEHGAMPIRDWNVAYIIDDLKRRRHGEHSKSALRLAVRGGHLDIVKLYFAHFDSDPIDVYIKPDVWNENKGVALWEAITENDWEITDNHGPLIDFLLERGVEEYMTKATRDTPLHRAVDTGNKRLIELLLQMDYTRTHLEYFGESGRTALQEAAKDDDLQIVRMLLESGAQIHTKTTRDDTALHWAVGHKKTYDDTPAIVKILIENGALINAANSTKETPLFWALGAGGIKRNPAIFKVFLDNGADIMAQNSNGDSPLIIAAGSGPLSAVKVLVEAGMDVNLRNKLGETALFHASKMNCADIAQFLLENGARGSLEVWETVHKRTPLLIAALRGHYGAAKILVDAGANVNITDDERETPLSLACIKDYDTSKLLVDAGANVNAIRYDRHTPLLDTIDEDQYETFKLLIDSGADIEFRRRNSASPLFHAARLGRFGHMQLLLDRGADINAKNEYGDTLETTNLVYSESEVKKLVAEARKKRESEGK
ncbi:hypothetical protein H072_8368 [Dactylellina haptotyla CBS 200.50]|uniref:DNA polymerase epsilon subunit B n=1 Tax=Dactylellina haptotyla (strain CBS 200.50) TaxID=1284197 RepID=S8AA23_DACHA|nr:hypothetical protein H072_8368 [Dactylellina haptotyla CBS 200.50]